MYRIRVWKFLKLYIKNIFHLLFKMMVLLVNECVCVSAVYITVCCLYSFGYVCVCALRILLYAVGLWTVCVCVCVRASVVHIAVCLLYSRGCVCVFQKWISWFTVWKAAEFRHVYSLNLGKSPCNEWRCSLKAVSLRIWNTLKQNQGSQEICERFGGNFGVLHY